MGIKPHLNQVSLDKEMGAKAMDEWNVYRVEGEALNELSSNF